ncbi:MAG: hypothetical protein RR177_05950 [Oscillospiraceae bacterium]
MDNNNNPNMSKFFEAASKKLGVDQNQLKNAANTGNIDDIINGLKPEDAKKLQHFLSNKDAARELLSSPQAQSLLKSFFGDKK